MANYIKEIKNFNTKKRKNFYTTELFQTFVWMFFHFTVVYFFMIRLENLALIGFFLGLGNFVSFLVDSPIGVLEKYFKAKDLFKTAAYMMLIVSAIFLYFTFSTNTLSFDEVNEIFSVEAFSWLFGSILNIIFLLVAVVFYGIIKELNEVTGNSYIMENSEPDEYSELFSKKSMLGGIGSLLGLLISGVVLAINSFIASLFLIIIVLIYLFFISKYFDNSEDNINFETFKKIKLITRDSIAEKFNSYKTEIIENREELINKTKNLKVIFLKPLELKDKINWRELIAGTREELKNFYEILFSKPIKEKLLIIGMIFVIFGFWDNFVTTFLIDFLDTKLSENSAELARYKIQNIMTAYVCIGLFCIPAYGAQLPLIKLSKKVGIWKLIIPGLVLSGISMFVFGLGNSLLFLLIAGLMNGIGYATCLPNSQGLFTNEYNITYAEKKNLHAIDSNASSAPLKMLANLANVIGLAFGGLLLQIFGYTGTFIMLGIIILSVAVLAIKDGKKIKLFEDL